jgi:hypothetical protein
MNHQQEHQNSALRSLKAFNLLISAHTVDRLSHSVASRTLSSKHFLLLFNMVVNAANVISRVNGSISVGALFA